jgi:hypothetical protein
VNKTVFFHGHSGESVVGVLISVHFTSVVVCF